MPGDLSPTHLSDLLPPPQLLSSNDGPLAVLLTSQQAHHPPGTSVYILLALRLLLSFPFLQEAFPSHPHV